MLTPVSASLIHMKSTELALAAGAATSTLTEPLAWLFAGLMVTVGM